MTKKYMSVYIIYRIGILYASQIYMTKKVYKYMLCLYI